MERRAEPHCRNLLVLLFTAATACNGAETRIDGPVSIGSEPVVIDLLKPAEGTGPAIDVEAQLPEGYFCSVGPWVAQAPDGRVIEVSVILEASDGRLDSLGPNPASQGGPASRCGALWGRTWIPEDTTRKYHRIRLQASSPIELRRLTIRTGNPRPTL